MIGTLAGFRQYAKERGLTAPTLSADLHASAALMRASDYVRFMYVQRFVSPYTELSPNVEPAVYEAALIELDKPEFFHMVFTPGERKVLTQVEGIRWEVLPGGNANNPTPVSAKIEAMLAPYMVSGIGIALYVI